MRKFASHFIITLLSFSIILAIVSCGEDEEEAEIPQVSRAAYIVNGAAETLSVFDIETSEMKNDVLTLGKIPNDIKIQGDKAYVVNYGDNNVQIIDLESLTDIGIIDVGDGAGPEKIAFADDNKAYVSCNNINSVKVIDLASQQVTKTIQVGVTPWGVATAGKKVYVCNSSAVYDVSSGAMSYGDTTVSVIDSSTDQVVKDIDVGTNPTEIVVSGDKVIVLCTGNRADISGELYVIDPASDEVSETINLGTTPSGIAASPGGMLYIAASGGLIPIDISSGTVGSALEDFPGGWGLAFDSDGNGYIAVPDWTGAGGDELLVMDASGNLVGTHTPGGGASIIAVRD